MELAKRDHEITRLSREIHRQKRMLRDRFNDLKVTSRENSLLDKVLDDYQEMYSVLRREKEEQKEALRLISEYLSDVTATTHMTESLLREAKHDQMTTLKEMDKLKHDIHELKGHKDDSTHSNSNTERFRSRSVNDRVLI